MTRIKQAHNHDPSQTAMFNQERAVSRRGAMKTSVDAAASISTQKIREAHRQILWLIQKHGPMTDYELRDVARREGFKFSWSGMSARRSELCPPRGFGLRDSGKTRPTPNDRPATVWEIDRGHAPEILPAKIRGLRPTQRQVYEIFTEVRRPLSHAELWDEYDRRAIGQRPGWETTLSPSGVRTCCAELGALKLLKRFPDTADGHVTWGLA